MFKVQLYYFDKNGNQHFKEIERKTRKGIISALTKFNEKNEIYEIMATTKNLYDDVEFYEIIDGAGW